MAFLIYFYVLTRKGRTPPDFFRDLVCCMFLWFMRLTCSSFPHFSYNILDHLFGGYFIIFSFSLVKNNP